MSRVGAALVDVGGTLWPDRWPSPPEDDARRIRSLQVLYPDLPAGRVASLHAALLDAGASLDGQVEQDVDRYVGETLRGFGLPATHPEQGAALDAMCIPASERVSLFPDARELLTTMRDERVRCVVFSNTVWRGVRSYWRDFQALGVAELVDAIVSSVDLGVRKPHRVMFEASAAAAGVPLDGCIVIGNSEPLDVQPARALGLRVLRVAIEEPPPEASQADLVTTSLQEEATVVRSWCRDRER